MDWLNIAAGFLVGVVVGITGVGGGSLMSPLLILFFGIAPATAIGTDLWFAAITKMVGGAVHHRHNNVDMQIVRRLAIGSIPAALLTGFWLAKSGTEHSSGSILSHTLGIVLILTALATLCRRWLATRMHRLPVRSQAQFPALQLGATIFAGAVLGVLVTLTSVGAGALGATMLMALYPRRLKLKTLVGTDIAHAVPLAIVGGVVHMLVGTVNLGLLVLLLVGSIPGIVIGSRLTAFIPERVVQPTLALVLTFSGIKLLTS